MSKEDWQKRIASGGVLEFDHFVQQYPQGSGCPVCCRKCEWQTCPRHLGFYATNNSRIGPKMNSMVPSIPFLDFRGASIAALGKFEIFVGFHHKDRKKNCCEIFRKRERKYKQLPMSDF